MIHRRHVNMEHENEVTSYFLSPYSYLAPRVRTASREWYGGTTPAVDGCSRTTGGGGPKIKITFFIFPSRAFFSVVLRLAAVIARPPRSYRSGHDPVIGAYAYLYVRVCVCVYIVGSPCGNANSDAYGYNRSTTTVAAFWSRENRVRFNIRSVRTLL